MERGAARYWPLFGLRVRTERVELRIPTDDDLAELLEVALSGVHPPSEMPFLVPWTRTESPHFERGFLQYHWGTRATWTPEAWQADFVVVTDGAIVGSQGLTGSDFAVTRAVSSGSWLGLRYQGRGVGTEMRAAMLHLAFAGLGAVEVRSSAFLDNLASAAVSRRLGYDLDGTEVHAVEGRRRVAQRFLLTRERWEAGDRIAAETEGLEACLPLFGAA
jgi:RimJ/RimL family protein N-acetyltransferase